FIEAAKRKNPAQKIVDLYENKLPLDIKDVFKLARTLILANEIVAPAVAKIAETPITKILVKGKKDVTGGDALEGKLRGIIDKVKLRSHMMGLSFDQTGYNNAFSSIYFAPTRYLVCPECERQYKPKKSEEKKEGRRKVKKYRWRAKDLHWQIKIEKGENNLQTAVFNGECPRKHQVKFRREDKIYHNDRSIRLIRWDPFYMDIDHYRALNRNEYYYRFS
ncbi:unnamed protein product, partial [marine sediment metagenome]